MLKGNIMGIGDIIGFVSAIAGMIIAYPAMLILLNILFNKTTSRVAHRLGNGMRLPFVVGVVVLVAGGFIIVPLLSAGSFLQLIGFVMYLLLSLFGTIGNAGMTRYLGKRASELGSRDPSPLNEMLSGGFVLTLSFAFPVIGWFVIMPIISAINIGAMTLGLFTRKSNSAMVEQSEVLVP